MLPMSTIQDELTGLNTRHGFFVALRRQIGYANEKQSNLALVVVDVNGFAAINNTHGYDFGDKLLQHVALQLNNVGRGYDYLARIGDNRFALILPRIMNKGHAELAVQKLTRLLDMPFEAGPARVKINVTIGVALCPSNATHADFLMRLAERSIGLAREAGQPCMFHPDDGLAEQRSEYWDMEIELSSALQRGELSMHYQPKVDCTSLVPVGAEALMRWNSRTRGQVSPELFIPVAERTGLIKPLTIWALNTVLRQAGEWKHSHGDLWVAVNMSADLVVQQDLPDLVEGALKLWGSEHVHLILEITERSLVIAPQVSFKNLSRIRDMGVKVSIDDFGTGYSCLAYFRDIPVDELKIDKSFVTGLLTEPANTEITHLIIDLAHRFGLTVVAEGIEDEQTLHALKELQCDVAQGFLLGYPMPHNEFQQWLNPTRGVASDFSGAALGVSADMLPPEFR